MFADGSHFMHKIKARTAVRNKAGAGSTAVTFGSAVGDELSFVAEQECFSEPLGTREEEAIAAIEELFDKVVLEDELWEVICVDLAGVGGPDLALCGGVMKSAGGFG